MNKQLLFILPVHCLVMYRCTTGLTVRNWRHFLEKIDFEIGIYIRTSPVFLFGQIWRRLYIFSFRSALKRPTDVQYRTCFSHAHQLPLVSITRADEFTWTGGAVFCFSSSEKIISSISDERNVILPLFLMKTSRYNETDAVVHSAGHLTKLEHKKNVIKY